MLAGPAVQPQDGAFVLPDLSHTFRLYKKNALVKKEAIMRKAAAWLIVAILLLTLTGCKDSRVNKVTTPGSLATPTPYTPHVSTEAEDVSAEYADRLCAYAWMDTYDMNYYLLSSEGTYRHLRDAELSDLIGTGKWQLLKDAEGYMTLHMAPDGGSAFDLYELELYEQSIYARGMDDR